MRTVNIRDISGSLLADAAKNSDTISVASHGRLVGVILPITQRLVEQIIEDNLSRLLRSVERGEREAAMEGEYTLDEVLKKGGSGFVTPGTTFRRIPIRDVSASAIEAAAQEGQVLGITSNGALAGMLIPITQRWIEQVVGQYLSRFVHSIERGEKEFANGDDVHLLDDLVKPRA